MDRWSRSAYRLHLTKNHVYATLKFLLLRFEVRRKAIFVNGQVGGRVERHLNDLVLASLSVYLYLCRSFHMSTPQSEVLQKQFQKF